MSKKVREYPIPDRKPDIILPRIEGSYCQVKIWIKECRFQLRDKNYTIDYITSNELNNGKPQTNPIKYLEDTLNLFGMDCLRGAVIAAYFAEQVLLGEGGE